MGGRRGRRNENGALRRRREGVLQAVVAMYNDASPHTPTPTICTCTQLCMQNLVLLASCFIDSWVRIARWRIYADHLRSPSAFLLRQLCKIKAHKRTPLAFC